MTSTRVAILCLAAGGSLFGQSYSGSVTSAGCSGVNGWAWNSASPADPINVAFYADTAYLGSWLANQYSGSNGNTSSGFSIPSGIWRNINRTQSARPRAAKSPAPVALPLSIHSKPAAINAPSIGPTI